MSKRARILAFGTAGLLVVVGVVVGVALGGTAGQIVALALVSVGGVIAVSLVFLEVGLSEDRERARERERARADREPGRAERDAPAMPRRRPHLGRMRGRRRHLG